MRPVWGRTGAIISAFLLLRERRALAVVAKGGHAWRCAAGLGLLLASAGDEQADAGEEQNDDDYEDAVGDGEEGLLCGRSVWMDRRWGLIGGRSGVLANLKPRPPLIQPKKIVAGPR